MSSAANEQTKSRTDRRKEWWGKNKEFQRKLRDRSQLSKKENEHHPSIVLPKVDTSRGFRSAIVSKLASVTPKPKKTVLNPKKLSPQQSRQKAARFSPKQDKVNSKKKTTTTSTKAAPHPPPQQPPPPPPSSKPAPAPATARAKVEKVVKETLKPEMSEISMNARGVELSAGGNHILQKYVLFVGNLPYTIDKGQLMSHFRKTGGVKSIRIPKEKNGKGKGFAYVEFKDRISHGIALRLHHTTLGGRRINVEFTNPDSKKKTEENGQKS